jgi:dipeptidyl aminopeptidase/acylaminoacyl peptidase
MCLPENRPDAMFGARHAPASFESFSMTGPETPPPDGSQSAIAYGSWTSPVTARAASSGAPSVLEIESDSGALYIVESRPAEGGRSTIIRLRPDGAPFDILPGELSARSRVHEYGGGALMAAAGTVYFVNDKDQAIWTDRAGGKPERLTDPGARRFADMILDAGRNRLIAVCEDHSGEGEPVNALVSVSLDNGSVTPLWSGADFVAHPRLSPDGSRLAWIAWDHPNMPWDATALWAASVTLSGALIEPRARIEAAEGHALMQPRWAEDGALYFLSDEPGDWSLYRWQGGASELVAHLDGEIGGPAWQFRASAYDLLSPSRAIAAITRRGADMLVTVDLRTGTARPVRAPFTAIRSVEADGRSAVVLAASPDQGFAVWRVEPDGGGAVPLYRPEGAEIAPALISRPLPLSFPSGGRAEAHGFYYPPLNPAFAAPRGSLPPLIVTAHGGPTAVSKPVFAAWRAFWTSRGFAVMDVNYRGSTGYGRPYRKALEGQWGEADIQDVVAAARYCAETGLADPARMAVYGGSAGGFAVLAALAFHDVFAAGVNLFGVSDLEMLARDTHKFESRYLDVLVGPFPQAADLYRARSPLHAAHRITKPLLTLQGTDDKVVPPSQSEAIHAAVRANGVPCAYLAFEGEGHGFRKAENQARVLTATLSFLATVFGLPRPPDAEPLTIENLPAA